MQYYISTRIKSAKLIMKLPVYDLFICLVTAFSICWFVHAVKRKGETGGDMHNFTHQNFTLKPTTCTQPRLHVRTQQSKQCKKHERGENTGQLWTKAISSTKTWDLFKIFARREENKCFKMGAKWKGFFINTDSKPSDIKDILYTNTVNSPKSHLSKCLN